MKKSTPEILMEKIDFIKKTENPCGILLVGSSRKILKAPSRDINDLDVFVIKESGEFQREVFLKSDIEYDISYISIDGLMKGLDQEIHSLIAVIANSEPLFTTERCIELVEKVKETYQRGPSEKREDFIRYKRFRLTKALEILEKKLDLYEFEFLIHNYLKELLIFHFEVMRSWIPSEKKLISSIKDQYLSDYVNELLNCKEQKKKLKSFESALDHILAPVGGRLSEWGKSIYPFDFN